MSKIKVLADWVSVKASLLGLQTATLSLRPHVSCGLSSGPGPPGVSYKDTRHVGLGLSLYDFV